jgi:hypothetical protein
VRVLTPMYNWLFQLFGEGSVIMEDICSTCSTNHHTNFIKKVLCPEHHFFHYQMDLKSSL